MAHAVKQDASYICIRECFTYNKHFIPGDSFPENWLQQGYKPNKHFAKAKDAFDEIERVKKESLQFCAGDDKRSTAEIMRELKKYMEVPPNYTRKEAWLQLVRHEAAANRDAPPKRIGRPPKKVSQDGGR